MLRVAARRRHAALPRAARSRAASASCEAAEEGPSAGQLQAANVLKALGGSWLVYNLAKVLWGGDTFFIGPNLVLLRSREPQTRETGISRISSWHTSDGPLTELIAQGGAESLVAALPAAQPETRSTVLELLVRIAPLSDGRARLVACDAERRAAEACDAIRSSDSAAAERCGTLARSLGEALRQAPEPEGGATVPQTKPSNYIGVLDGERPGRPS